MLALTQKEYNRIGEAKGLSFLQGCIVHEIITEIKQVKRRLTKGLIQEVCGIVQKGNVTKLEALRVEKDRVQIFINKGFGIWKHEFLI